MGRGGKTTILVYDGVRSFLVKIIVTNILEFRDDGLHLSDIGNAYLLKDFRLKIKQNILF